MSPDRLFSGKKKTPLLYRKGPKTKFRHTVPVHGRIAELQQMAPELNGGIAKVLATPRHEPFFVLQFLNVFFGGEGCLR